MFTTKSAFRSFHGLRETSIIKLTRCRCYNSADITVFRFV